MKYRVTRGVVATLLVFITFFYPLLAPTPHRIDEAHAKMIVKGMTYAQVEAVFGVSPGDYDSAEWDTESLRNSLTRARGNFDAANYVPSGLVCTFDAAFWVERNRRTKQWLSRNGIVNVRVDHNGVVEETWYSDCVRVVPLWERLQRWLHHKG